MGRTRTALVLSGGGARGAYHIGVIEALVAAGWMRDGVGPDMIAGTSIGAINAAALASGRTVAELRRAWLEMHTEDVHRLSPDLPNLARPLVSFLLRSVLTSEAHGGSAAYPMPLGDHNQSAQSLLSRLSDLFRSRPFRSLLDTQPWRHTLQRWMDFERINSPQAPALLITATELLSGRLELFSNRTIGTHTADTISIDHLMASSSIPAIYPWTTIGDRHYWDGAVLANTPLDPLIDLAGDDDLDIFVVMMTPWSEDGGTQHIGAAPLDMLQAISLTLDWALLASYRVAFANLRQRNQIAEAAERLRRAAALTGDLSLLLDHDLPRPIRLPTVIAPQEPMPLEWIVDYETHTHERLFTLGRADAQRALAQR